MWNLKKDEKIILGIDPGTKITGYGIIKTHQNTHIALDFGCIRPTYKLNLSKRYFTSKHTISCSMIFYRSITFGKYC